VTDTTVLLYFCKKNNILTVSAKKTKDEYQVDCKLYAYHVVVHDNITNALECWLFFLMHITYQNSHCSVVAWWCTVPGNQPRIQRSERRN